MTVIKTARDIGCMRLAGEISAGALAAAKDCIRVGVSTAAIDRTVREYIRSRGAEPSFLGYGGFPGSACISVNGEVIHGIPGERRLENGDIVSVDVGAYCEGFHGDNAATFAVGTVDGESRRLIDVTKECLFRGIAAAKCGGRIGDIGHAVQQYAEQNGFSAVRAFIGHGVGRELHESPEVPNFGKPGRGPRIMPGMTFAIEPMINAGGFDVDILDDGWTVVTKDGSRSAHFEMTVAVTDSETLLLTDWRRLL